MLLLLPLVPGCARRAGKPATERLAVLRFENLGADPAGDWMGRAFSEVVATSLAHAPGIYAIPSARLHSSNQALGIRNIAAPGVSAERTMALVAGATRIGYGNYLVRGGHLEVSLAIEDPQAGRMVRVISAVSGGGDVISAASELARRISDGAVPFGTRSNEALKAWIDGLESPSADSARQALEHSIASDPDFGPPYRLLAQWKAQRQDRAGALATLEQALSRGTGVSALERARMELEAANLRSDGPGRQAALVALVRLDPGDPLAWRLLGETATARRDYPQAVQAFEKSLALEPDELNSLNQLGYAAAFAGAFDEGVRALRRYEALRPADANAQDSLGDIHLIAGRFREAESFYLAAAKKSPGFMNHADLFKAAMARLMGGDPAGADELARQYADARASAGDPMAPVHRAEWSWIAGRRREGYRQLEEVARANESGPLKELAARAYAELAIWSLVLGDRAAAMQMAQRSAPLAGQSSAGISIVARFLAQPSAPPAEWAARTARLFSTVQGSLRDLTLGYALLLDGHFGPASTVLKQVYGNSGPSDEGTPVLLAWALVESGRPQDADPLLRANPVPPAAGAGPLMSLYFPRLYHLRAITAEKLGRTGEAQAAERFYQQIGGPATSQPAPVLR